MKIGLEAVVLAAAGLRRLGLEDSITELLPLDDFPPSPGQGAMGIQLRAADTELLEMLNFYGDPATNAAVLTAQVTSLNGTQRVFATATGADAQLLGTTLTHTIERCRPPNASHPVKSAPATLSATSLPI